MRLMITLAIYLLFETATGKEEESYSYLGCYNNSIGKTPETYPTDGKTFKRDDKITTNKCRYYCFGKKDLPYFGMTEGSRCYCWNSSAGYQVYGNLPLTSCDHSCPGNESNICGGARAISIYGDSLVEENFDETRCPTNFTQQNGRVVSLNDTSVTFSCDFGFVLKGDEWMRCNITSSQDYIWIGVQPTCEDYRFHMMIGLLSLILLLLGVLLTGCCVKHTCQRSFTPPPPLPPPRPRPHPRPHPRPRPPPHPSKSVSSTSLLDDQFVTRTLRENGFYSTYHKRDSQSDSQESSYERGSTTDPYIYGNETNTSITSFGTDIENQRSPDTIYIY